MADDPPRLAWRAFRVPKAGQTLQECEDAFAGSAGGGRFAVADGASESGFAGAWARLLARYYVRQPGAWARWLPAARRRWLAEVRVPDLPWYAEAKIEEGAFATLLGVHFADDRASWQAEAVGDSCLFQVRQGRLRRAFPVRRSDDFTSCPSLVGSQNPDRRLARPGRSRLRGEWHEGDCLLLMTDALAHWFLKDAEADRRPWRELLEFRDEGRFAEWVGRLRQVQALRNDDVTLVYIRARRIPG
jgi:hypothetical protein